MESRPLHRERQRSNLTMLMITINCYDGGRCQKFLGGLI